jgi:hypothetical protein
MLGYFWGVYLLIIGEVFCSLDQCLYLQDGQRHLRAWRMDVELYINRPDFIKLMDFRAISQEDADAVDIDCVACCRHRLGTE